MIENKGFIPDDRKDRKSGTEKTVRQKIASAQMRLNRLQSKDRAEQKKNEARQKIILGAEVAKVLGSNVFDVDKELILVFLSDIPKLSDEDVIKYKKRGRLFLAGLSGRQF